MKEITLVEGSFWLILFLCLVVQSYIDLKYRLLLDEVNLVLAFTGVVYAFNQSSLMEAAWGCASLGGSLALIFYFSNGSLGLGDVKLGLALGPWLGGAGGWLCLVLALILGGAVGLLGWALGLWDRKALLPFGPYIGTAAIVVMVQGEAIGKLFW